MMTFIVEQVQRNCTVLGSNIVQAWIFSGLFAALSA